MENQSSFTMRKIYNINDIKSIENSELVNDELNDFNKKQDDKKD